MPKPKQKEKRAWPASKVEFWPIEAIHPYPRNARLHSDEQIDLIAASIQKYGFTSPLLVDEEGVLIYGHGRHRAAQKLGITDVPVCVAEGWSEEDKAAYRIADNQIALRSEWDMPLLKTEVAELQLTDYNLELLGFDERTLSWMSSDTVELDPQAQWVGMPEFVQNDKKAFRSIMVHFQNQEAVDAFEKAIGKTLGPKKRYIWLPEIEIEGEKNKRYVTDESAVPDLHHK